MFPNVFFIDSSRVIQIIKKMTSTGLFHIFGANVVNKILAFLSSIVLVRVLTKEEFGIFSYAWNIFSLILLLCGCGLYNSVLQLCSERRNEPEFCNKVFSYSLLCGSVFNIFLFSLTLFIGLFIPLSIERANKVLIATCCIYFLYFYFECLLLYMRAECRNKMFAYFNLGLTFVMLLFSVVGAYFWKIDGLVVGKYLTYFLACLSAYHFFGRFRFHKSCLNLPCNDKKLIWKIGSISMVNNGLSQLLYLIDVFFVGTILKDELIISSYRTAVMIPTALSFIPSSIATYVYPYFAFKKNDGKWCLRRYYQILGLLGGINVIISSILFVFASQIILLLFGSQYLDAVPVFRILSISYFFAGTFRILAGNLLITQRKLIFNFGVALSSGLLNIVLDVVLIRLVGSIGAAFATVFIVLLTSIANVSYLIHTFKRNVKR